MAGVNGGGEGHELLSCNYFSAVGHVFLCSSFSFLQQKKVRTNDKPLTGRGEGAHDFMQGDKIKGTGNYVEEDKNASAHPSPPTPPFPEKR